MTGSAVSRNDPFSGDGMGISPRISVTVCCQSPVTQKPSSRLPYLLETRVAAKPLLHCSVMCGGDARMYAMAVVSPLMSGNHTKLTPFIHSFIQ